MTVTPRKLQKLGASSIVVTLPHEWVKAHGLKAGDTVYVIDEGDKLRIVPALSEERHATYVFQASRLAVPHLVPIALTCLYVNNLNDIVVDFKGLGDSALSMLKDEASRLLGVEVMSIDKEKAAVRVVLDESKLDPRHAIKGLGIAVANISSLLRRVSEGDSVSDSEVKLALDDLLRYQHLVLRYLVGNAARQGSMNENLVYSMTLGTALLGVVGNVLLDAVNMAKRDGLKSDTVAKVAAQLSDLTPLVGAMVAQPSLKRLHEATMGLVALTSSIEAQAASLKDVREAMVLAKVDDALKTLQIIFMVILCSAIMNEGLVRPESGLTDASEP